MKIWSLLVVAACGAPAKPAVESGGEGSIDCAVPSRACTLRELAAATTDLAAFAKLTYGAYGAIALAKLEARGFERLIVDPAVVLRLDAFVAFAAQAPHAPHATDPWLARERFAASLGTRRVYRAVSVDDATAASIHASGILAPTVRANHAPFRGHLLDLLAMHVTGSALPEDPLMSVSDDRVIAKCVAHGFAKEGTYVAVYAIDAPALDVFAIDERSSICPALPPPATGDCKMLPPLNDDTRAVLCRGLYSPAIESFVHSRIDAKEIVEVAKPTDFSDCDDALARAASDFGPRAKVARGACKPS